MSGEPAFPIYANGLIHDGMTLRDWFAGQALASFTNWGSTRIEQIGPEAAACYMMADAMMAAREAKR